MLPLASHCTPFRHALSAAAPLMLLGVAILLLGGCKSGGGGKAPNTPPTISAIADQSTTAGTTVGPLSFTIADTETPLADLVVTAQSSNTGLLPQANMSLGGSGGERTITLTPAAGQTGATAIILTVADGGGLTATTSFLLMVTEDEPEETPPTISAIADQRIAENATLGPLPFTIGDAETPVDDLVMSVTSSNTSLVPQVNISLGGSGAERTLSLTPLGGMTGEATITVTVVNESGLSTTRSFLLTVLVIGGSVDLVETYVIIDISAGSDAVTYPVSESATLPEDIHSDLYKTDRIVLRRIPAGTYTMGSPEEELGRSSNETQREVTLTSEFYMGVFQITQRQWMNVMGPANPALHKGDALPVWRVPWPDARGGTWSGNNRGYPALSSFVGRLAEKSAIYIDLPTEAQWEYAARAGTATALHNGEDLTTATGICPNLEQLGHHGRSGAGGTPIAVGSYLANAWGLYDMHGNIAEWCLDWYQDSLGTSAITDPAGPNSGSQRVARGGGYRSDAGRCRSAAREGVNPTYWLEGVGLRIVALPEHPGGGGNTRPSITNIAHQTTSQGTAIGPIPFTVGDAETATADLVITAQSTNFRLLRENDITFGGSGANRTVTLRPRTGINAGNSGATTITLTVEDEGGLAAETSFVLTVIGDDFIDGSYIIVDISGGPDATTYPVQEVGSLPENLNTNYYKTDRIVMRKVPAGVFMMGSPEDEFGSRVVAAQDNEDLHQVTITQDFYIGVFAVTQRQYMQVMGYNPNDSNNVGMLKPASGLNWATVRGGSWEGSAGGAPNPDTFIGRLSAKTGIPFDLPTDAQWEKAARGGTTSAIYTGGDITDINNCPVMNTLAHYWGIVDDIDVDGLLLESADVGFYRPNPYGLYDIYGNVTEWCLDWYQAKLGHEAVTDPVGPPTGIARVTRGGGKGVYALGQRSASRISVRPERSANQSRGFRLAITLSPESDG